MYCPSLVSFNYSSRPWIYNLVDFFLLSSCLPSFPFSVLPCPPQKAYLIARYGSVFFRIHLILFKNQHQTVMLWAYHFDTCSCVWCQGWPWTSADFAISTSRALPYRCVPACLLLRCAGDLASCSRQALTAEVHPHPFSVVLSCVVHSGCSRGIYFH